MKNPNGYGCVKKLSGNRRKPYAIFITSGFKWNEGKAVQVQKAIGYFETQKEAMLALAKYNEDPYDLESKSFTFKEVWEQLQKSEFSGKSKSVMKSYTTSYNKCDQLYDMKFRDIRATHLESVLKKEEGKSISTQQNILKLYRAMYNYAIRYDIANKNYADYIVMTDYTSTPSSKVPFTKTEIEKVWDNLSWAVDSNGNTAEKSHLVDSVIFLLYSGLRLEEFMNLRCKDVHGAYIDIYGTKNKQSVRMVPIHEKIDTIVKNRLNKGNEYLFTFDNGNRLTETQYRDRFFKVFCNNVLKTNHTPHECRHTFITFGKSCGMNDYALKKIVGHKIGDVTGDVYGHITTDNVSLLNCEINKLNY